MKVEVTSKKPPPLRSWRGSRWRSSPARRVSVRPSSPGRCSVAGPASSARPVPVTPSGRSAGTPCSARRAVLSATGAGKGIQWAARTPAGQAVTGWAGRQASRIPGVQRLAENLGAKGAGEGAQEASSVTDDALNSVATPANASPTPRAELPATPARPQIEPPGKIGPDFIADDQGTIIPTSRTRLEEGLQSAGLDTFSTDSPGTGYVLPDGSRVRVMDATKYASQRASFTNANDGPVSPFTGKPPNPPKEISNTKKWVRERCHIDLFD